MKRIFALMLVFVSTLVHAQDSTLEKLAPLMTTARAALLEGVKPLHHSLVVDELVDTLEMHDVEVVVSSKPVDGVAFYFQGLIVLGADVAALPREQLAFILAHEYGHHTRMHWRSTLSRGTELARATGKKWDTLEDISSLVTQAASPEVSRNNELDADAAAISKLKEFGLLDKKAIINLMTNFFDPSDTDTHPSGSVRAKALALSH